MLGKHTPTTSMISFSRVFSYIRRRDLSTVLSKDTLSILNNTPRLSKTFSFDDKLPIKRSQQSSSIASDSDGMSDSTSKRAKLETSSQTDSTSL